MRIIKLLSCCFIMMTGCTPFWQKATVNTGWKPETKCSVSYGGPILDTIGFATAGSLILAYHYDPDKTLQKHSGGKENEKEFLTMSAILGVVYMISAYMGYAESTLQICKSEE